MRGISDTIRASIDCTIPIMQLDPPARYFPITRGLYEVAPGLKLLGTDFGNGAMDRRVFQIDADFPRFRQSKLACRQDRIENMFNSPICRLKLSASWSIG